MSGENNIAAALATSEANAEMLVGDKANLMSELEKAKHTSDVWRGHATKRAEKIKELEEELRKLKEKNLVSAVAESIPAEMKEGVPDEIINASLTGAKALVDGASTQSMEAIAKLKEEMAENNKRVFLRQLSLNHGKFLEKVGPGGENEKLWNQFKEHNRETFEAIMRTQDVDRFNEFVGQFCGTFGLPNLSGSQSNTTTSEPASKVGSVMSVSTSIKDDKVFSTQEYLSELEKAEDARNAGDMKTYREMTAKLTKALNEGRVKNN